ncbi:MAG: hypothetical protein R2940_16465 [Syntrophotaleaceae bacterium]
MTEQQKLFCASNFTQTEIQLILEAFEDISSAGLQHSRWPLPAIAKKVFQAMKGKNLDWKWKIWNSVVMSKIYRMSEVETQTLKDFLVEYKEASEDQREQALKLFSNLGGDFKHYRLTVQSSGS